MVKFEPDGSAAAWCTTLGGSAGDEGNAIAVHPDGRVSVGGWTNSTDFPVPGGFQTTLQGSYDGFLARLAADGASLEFGTYLGGTSTGNRDEVLAVAADRTALIAGGTTRSDSGFPLANPFQGSHQGGGWDGFFLRLVETPVPPSDPKAILTGLTRMQVSWTDESDDETGFRVERRTEGGAFQEVGTTGAGVAVFEDSGLDYLTTYTYRVAAFNTAGDSPWSDEVSRDTASSLPQPPLAPSGLDATVLGPARVLLSWVDESFDETHFQVLRQIGTGPFAVLATPNPGTTSYEDATVEPDLSYTYKVRAANALGPSLDSNLAAASTPATATMVLEKGTLKKSTKVSKDSLRLQGLFSPVEGEDPVDPTADGWKVWIGGREGTRVLQILPASDGWVSKKGTWRWKSPKGSLTKASLVLDPATGGWKLALKKLALPAVPENPVVLSLRSGPLAVTEAADWTAKKATLLKYP